MHKNILTKCTHLLKGCIHKKTKKIQSRFGKSITTI